MGHTPGPWAVHPWGDNDYEINAALDTVCNVPGFDDDTVDVDMAEANARLIAAAPELLRELKFAVSVLQDNHIARGVAAALAAIRRAEGRSE